MNLRLRAYIHTARRLVQNQNLRLRFEPPPQDQLLLIAAGKRVDRLFGSIKFHLKLPDDPCCGIPLSAAEDKTKTSHLPQCRNGQVAPAGVRRKNCFIKAILGQIRQPCLHCRSRLADPQHSALKFDFADVRIQSE